jgi:tetratricopeptide (TPR) repeat protein
MAKTPREAIKLFYCYARKDKPLRDELEIHLSWLKRRFQLTNWHDREILPGEEWEQAIDKNLNTAHLIILLISPDFMASDYCFGKEMRRALERHKEGTCRVIPIILRPTYWEDAPFSSIQLLPTNAKPITSWPNPDEAFQDVVTEISRTIKDLLKEEWFEEDVTLSDLKRYEEELAAYEQTIHLDPTDAHTYFCKGNALYHLKRYAEALATYEQAIHLDSTNADYYYMKGHLLYHLKRYKKALAAYEQAIRLDPNYVHAYNNKGDVLSDLKRYQEAEQAFEKARQLE